MKCPFCGREFDENDNPQTCKGCSLTGGGCGMIKCPHCGYETPRDTWLVKLLRRWSQRKHDRSKD